MPKLLIELKKFGHSLSACKVWGRSATTWLQETENFGLSVCLSFMLACERETKIEVRSFKAL